MKKVLVLLAEGFEDIEALSIIDIFRRAKINVVLSSLNHLNVLSGSNIQYKSDLLIDYIDVEEFDLIFLPGGNLGFKNLKKDHRVLNLLKKANLKQQKIAAICAAPIVLFEAGILNGNYTCYPGCEKQILSGNYLLNEDIVSCNNIYTSRGVGTSLNFAFYLLDILLGEDVTTTIRQSTLCI